MKKSELKFLTECGLVCNIAPDIIDDVDFDDDMVAFVFDSTGMMGSFTMEGTKFERIKP